MGDVEDFVIGVAYNLLESLEPLPRLARSEPEFAGLLAELGWPVPAGADLSGVRAPFDIGETLTGLRHAIAVADLDDPTVVATLVTGIVDLAALVQAMTSGPPDRATLPAPFNSTTFWSTFPEDLFQILLIRTLERGSPAITALLAFVGVIDEYEVPAAPPRLAYRRQALDFNNLAQFLRDPLQHMRDQFGWGEGRVLNQDRVLVRLRRLASLLGPAAIGEPREDSATPYWSPTAPARMDLRELFATLFEAYDVDSGVFGSVTIGALPIPARNTPAGNPIGLALRVDAAGGGSVAVEIPLGPLTLAVEGGLRAQAGLVVELWPDAIDARLTGVSATVEAALALRRDTTLLLFGSPNGMRVEVGRMEFRLGVAGDPSDLEFLIGFTVQRFAFIIQASSADSFLGSFLGTDPQPVTVDFDLQWSSKKGIRLAAAGGLRFVIPAHLDIAILRIETIVVELVAGTDSGISLNLAVDPVITIGPVVATVSRVGARLLATPPEGGTPGNLGPLQLGFGFKPPDGAGIRIDAAMVKGGGFARFDYAAGEYSGILQLSIKDYLSITAIVVVVTKLPDGSEGFSLLVILTAQFPPIQLGYGFTLSGLGGIFGLNRTMSTEALRSGARTGVLDSILFPPDPLKNVPKVISDVQSVFPVAPGRFVIGLMARIGWGAGLVTVDLGIIVEIPMPIVIALLGRVAIALPTKDEAVVKLNLHIVGIIDLGRSEISIDATLYDSRVAIFNITGDMAVRIGWGASKIFAISAGGFHPRFEAPPGFPDLRRLAITLATSENPLVRLETYLALTSNSVQVGARLEVYAELDTGAFGLFSAQAFLGFDVLVTLQPFGFVASLYGGVAIKRNGKALLSAEVFLELSGPEPWHAWGYAELNFLVKLRLPVDITVGQEPAPVAPAVLDPIGDLLTALADERNWTAQLPATGGVVTLREFDHPAVLAHPLGRLGVRQRVVPLEVTIDTYGGSPVPVDAQRFALAFAIGGEPADDTRTPVRDDLPPGQYFAMSDDQKLSRPAFEPLLCGYGDIGAPLLSHGPGVAGSDEYETRVVDAEEPAPRTVADAYTVHSGVLTALVATDSERYGGPDQGIAVTRPLYLLASNVDMRVTGTAYPTYVEAEQARAGTDGRFQVVGAHEVMS